MNIYDYQAAFGKADITSRAMKSAMKKKKKLYYLQPGTEHTDPCQRIAYTVVSKLRRAVFAEYAASSRDSVASAWLKELEKHKDTALEMALSGGECYLKPYPNGAGFSYTLIPRENVLIFARDRDGDPVDVGCVERICQGKFYYTLLERRCLQGDSLLIENKLYRAASREALGQQVSLKECAAYAHLPEKWLYPVAHLGLVRMKCPTANCVDGSADGVAVFAPAGAKADEALAAGADAVGMHDLAEKMQGGDLSYDVVIATPDAMRVVGKLGTLLGPRGLMPNPKVGTVSPNPGEAVKNAKGGQVRYRTDKAGIIHCTIGKADFEPERLQENLQALLTDLVRAKPAAAKGTYLQKVSISSTMGPGVIVDQGSLALK